MMLVPPQLFTARVLPALCRDGRGEQELLAYFWRSRKKNMDPFRPVSGEGEE